MIIKRNDIFSIFVNNKCNNIIVLLEPSLAMLQTDFFLRPLMHQNYAI